MQVLLVGNPEANAQTKALLQGNGGGGHLVTSWPNAEPNAASDTDLDLGWPADIPVIEVARLAHVAKVDLVILTTEDAIQSGIANVLQVYRIPCFGPTRVAAHFLWDPEYLVRFMKTRGIATTAESVHYTLEDATSAALQCIAVHRRIAIRTRNARGETDRFVCTSRADVKHVLALSVPPDRQDAVQYLIERDSVESPHRFVYLVSETRAILAHATGSATETLAPRVAESVVQPFLRGMATEGTPYSGWLTFEVVVRGKMVLVRSVGCLPDPATLDDLACDREREWVQLITFVMHGLAPVHGHGDVRCA